MVALYAQQVEVVPELVPDGIGIIPELAPESPINSPLNPIELEPEYPSVPEPDYPVYVLPEPPILGRLINFDPYKFVF